MALAAADACRPWTPPSKVSNGLPARDCWPGGTPRPDRHRRSAGRAATASAPATCTAGAVSGRTAISCPATRKVPRTRTDRHRECRKRLQVTSSLTPADRPPIWTAGVAVYFNEPGHAERIARSRARPRRSCAPAPSTPGPSTTTTEAGACGGSGWRMGGRRLPSSTRDTPLAAVSLRPGDLLDVLGTPWKVGSFLPVDLPLDPSSPFRA